MQIFLLAMGTQVCEHVRAEQMGNHNSTFCPHNKKLKQWVRNNRQKCDIVRSKRKQKEEKRNRVSSHGDEIDKSKPLHSVIEIKSNARYIALFGEDEHKPTIIQILEVRAG